MKGPGSLNGRGRGMAGREGERWKRRGEGLRHGCWGIDAPGSWEFILCISEDFERR